MNKETSYMEFIQLLFALGGFAKPNLILASRKLKSTFKCSVSVLEYFRALSFLSLNNRR